VLTYKQCDVTDEASVSAAFEEADAESRFPLRGLITCAGISGRSDAVDYPIDAFRRIIEVNLVGTFLCARAAARIFNRRMLKGSIVMLASMSGHVVNQVSPIPLLPSRPGLLMGIFQGVNTCAYNASKAAVLQLARNLAAEWGGDSGYPPIRVNTLSPGYIVTPIVEPTIAQIPGLHELWSSGNMLRRLSTVDEHQTAVVFLLSDSSSYITAADLDASAGHTAW
jgi:NAD(P)-dependent dehydrogenase (short-subunit alcohol dehydrogenase family)